MATVPQKLIICNVDLSLLNRQRRILGVTRPQLDVSSRRRVTVALSPAQADALCGILNMLDAWSDEQLQPAPNVIYLPPPAELRAMKGECTL